MGRTRGGLSAIPRRVLEYRLNMESTFAFAKRHAFVILASLLVLLGAAGGYYLGRTSGEDLATARSSGVADGRNEGAKAGEEEGFGTGFKLGREGGYPAAYERAFEAAFEDQFTELGLKPPR